MSRDRRVDDRCGQCEDGRTYFYARDQRYLSLCKRCTHLSLFKLTKESYQALLDSQGGGCAICGSKDNEPADRNLCIDHDRSCCDRRGSCGKCVRGILCNNCNRAIGMLGESSEVLRRAIRYLDGSVHEDP